MDIDDDNVSQGHHTPPEVATPTVDTPCRVPASGPEPDHPRAATPQLEGDPGPPPAASCHLTYREQLHADAIGSFDQTIDDLNRRLAAASAARAQPTSSTHPQLQARLYAVLAAHEAAVRDLGDAQESIRAFEASQAALENPNHLFWRQIANLRPRSAQAEASAATTLSKALEERDRLQSLLDRSDHEVHDHLASLHQACTNRDRDRVASSWSATTRLERLNHVLEASIADTKRVRTANAILRTDLASAVAVGVSCSPIATGSSGSETTLRLSSPRFSLSSSSGSAHHDSVYPPTRCPSPRTNPRSATINFRFATINFRSATINFSAQLETTSTPSSAQVAIDAGENSPSQRSQSKKRREGGPPSAYSSSLSSRSHKKKKSTGRQSR
ncbi:unnamed protein product [Phytophthora fragariaefolia]|uniref:Unnamed protein product n=1 Tax=Phytophthora fragariaefolia TaxID=1490495 RepID=A0A9W6XWZ0_9STRA|nr:unnamed protein product [Phytophthora fragariaefolia]